MNGANVEIHVCTFERNQSYFYVSAFISFEPEWRQQFLNEKRLLELSSNWGGGISTL